MQDSRVGALTFQPKAFTLTKIQGLSWFPHITPFPKSFSTVCTIQKNILEHLHPVH